MWLVLRERQQAAPPAAGWASPPEWTSPPTAAPSSAYAAYGPPGPLFGPPPPPPPPPPPRPRSDLGALTVSALVLVVGLLLLASALGLDGVTAPRVAAVALLVTGAGLVVGARWGRSRGLIVLAVVLALLLAAVSAADRAFGSESGERTWTVNGSTVRELGAGTATLDLRPLAGTSASVVTVEGTVGGGELLVLVPDDLRVVLDADVGAGEYRLTGEDGPRQAEAGFGLNNRIVFGPDDGPLVRVHATVGVGELEVRRVDSP